MNTVIVADKKYQISQEWGNKFYVIRKDIYDKLKMLLEEYDETEDMEFNELKKIVNMFSKLNINKLYDEWYNYQGIVDDNHITDHGLLFPGERYSIMKKEAIAAKATKILDLKKKQKGKKDYTYRGTWKHKFSRARNKERRGGMTKDEMMRTMGRFPRKNEWWGPTSEKEWKIEYLKKFPN